MIRDISLRTAIDYLKRMFEDYCRVFGEDHKTVRALKKILEALKIAYPNL